MAAIAIGGGFPARPRADRNAFLGLTALVWLGVLSGFGTDSFIHVSQHGFDYPLIVHVHAMVFVSWLVLFTTQVALIRADRADLHKRLGVAGAVLAAVMVVLGPATALTVDGLRYTATGETPGFLAVQLGDIVAFTLLTSSGLLLRGTPSAHKRLMLIGLIFISAAGFARFLNAFLAAPFGKSWFGGFAHLYMGSDLILIALGAYDLITRRKLHPAYIAGAVLTLLVQVCAETLLHSPAWKTVALHLIGH